MRVKAMTSIYEIHKANRIGRANDFWTALVAQKWRASEEEFKEYTGSVPVTINANGSPLISWMIKGNTVQNGTPSPTTPIQPQGTGERTGNLLNPGITRYEKAYFDRIVDFSGGAMYIVPIKSNTTYTVKTYTDESIEVFRIGLYNKPVPETGDTVDNIVRKSGSNPTATITNTDYKYLMIQISGKYVDDYGLDDTVLNEGSTALPYEPYGIKIPISSANTTTPVYLGEVQSTRQIKKLVLDGTESTWRITGTGRLAVEIPVDGIIGKYCVCSHYKGTNVTSLSNLNDKECEVGTLNSSNKQEFVVYDTDYSTAADFKAYLAQQYAVGTPVTVWYVLAEPATGIVNEPLMKIGGYADTLGMEQAGVSIPTNNGSTTVDVETTLKPSEVYIKYKGR